MPKLIIDDREIEVAEGVKVIDAAEQLGIVIPRFCFHPALGSVGACRVCAVKFLEGRIKGIHMSCMIDAMDGMVISTTDEEAVAFRKRVMEFLMLSHPHDCPVCDEGGHCLLQDLTVAGGHGIRRFKGSKITHNDQYLGPLVQHEMNRCIKCYRCSRFYQEFCGYFDLGVMQIGAKVYYGRFRDGVLESPFTGNLSDICPTGVYTDRPSRYKGRRWDYERTPTVCLNCSLGCLTTTSSRYREIVRQEAAHSEKTNGHFICDRGRFGFYYASLPERPTEAVVDGREEDFAVALKAAREKIEKISAMYGPSSLALAGSTRNSLETMAVFNWMKRENPECSTAFFLDQRERDNVQAASSRLAPNLSVSLKQVEKADLIFAVGVDPINEAPMLALAMRQAQRNGGHVVVIDPRPVELPLDFTHIPVAQNDLSCFIARMINAFISKEARDGSHRRLIELCGAIIGKSGDYPGFERRLPELRGHVEKCDKPVVICGADLTDANAIKLAADFAHILDAKKDAGLFYTLHGANSFAAGLFGDVDSSLEEILSDIEGGKIKALVLVENDPFVRYHNKNKIQSALDKLEFLVVIDYLDSRAAKAADIFLPCATVFETGGVFINQEGRARGAPPSVKKGVSVEQEGKGNHPSRIFDLKIRGGEVLPAWRIFSELIGKTEDQEPEKVLSELFGGLSDSAPKLAGMNFDRVWQRDGELASFAPRSDKPSNSDYKSDLFESSLKKEGICILAVENTFGTEELSTYSPCLKKLEKKPVAYIHPETMNSLGISSGDMISVGVERSAVIVPAVSAEKTALDTIVIPRLKALDWRVFESMPAYVDRKSIKKVNS